MVSSQNRANHSAAENATDKNAFTSTVIHPEQISDPLKYTLFCMRDLAGFHISRILSENYSDLNINYEIIDTQTTIMLYRPEISDEKYTFGSFLLAREQYDEATRLIHHLIRSKTPCDKIENALQIETINKRMKSSLYQPINLTGCATINALEEAEKTFLAHRSKRDDCFALIAETIGAENFFTKIFGQPNQEPMDLTQKYLLNPKSKQAHTIIDICLQYGLPKTAVVILKQAYAKNKNHQDVINLIGGEITKSKLRRYKQSDKTSVKFNTTANKNAFLSSKQLKIYQEKFQANEHLETIEPVITHLISTLPLDLCYEHVLQEAVPYYLKTDFDLHKQEKDEISSQQHGNSTPQQQDTSNNNTQVTTATHVATPQLKQTDFLYLLDASINGR